MAKKIGGKPMIGGKPTIGAKGENSTPVPNSTKHKPLIPMAGSPDHMNPDTLLKLDSIDGLFKTIHRMITSLTDFNAEFQLKMPSGKLFWLVPAYTSEKATRREISFKDAATVTVICAAYGGEVVDFRFVDEAEEGEI